MLILRRRSSTRSRTDMAVTSAPSSRTLPALGSMRRLIMRTRVDLPEPDSPITTNSSPCSIRRVTSRTPTAWPVDSSSSALDMPRASAVSAVSTSEPKTLLKCSSSRCMEFDRLMSSCGSAGCPRTDSRCHPHRSSGAGPGSCGRCIHPIPCLQAPRAASPVPGAPGYNG